MLVILARLGTPEIVGQFVIGLAVTAPVIMFASLALRQVQATDSIQEYAFGEYFGLRIITTVLAFATICAIALSAYQNQTVLVIVIMGIAKSFETFSDVIYGLLQQHERMDRIAQSMIIKGPVSLVVLTAGVILTDSVVGGVVGLALVWGLLFLFFDLPNAYRLKGTLVDLLPKWNTSRLMKLAWIALPLGFVMMLISLNSNIPRFFVERYLGEAQLGIYASIAYLAIAGNTIVGALGQTVSPRLAKYYSNGDRRAYWQLLLRVQAIGIALGLAGILAALVCGKFVLNLLYGSEYAAEAGILIWIMIAASISYLSSFLSYGVTAAHVFKLQIILSGFPALVALGASFLFIPNRGLEGAVMVLIFSNLTSYLLRFITILWIIRKSPSTTTAN